MSTLPTPDPLADAPPLLRRLVDDLSKVPGVDALALGGSRAAGTHHAGSDWDLGVYYRDGFRPADVRALGYPGTVVELGEWGGGVFNGGAWLDLDGTRVDLLWRDLAVVERELDDARAGRWRIEPLMFHLTGIPTYLLLAELAVNRVLHGELPRPGYPSALREAAGHGWAQRAELTLGFARTAHARAGRMVPCLGLVAVGASEYAHAAAATAGVWVTNDKRLLEHGGMGEVEQLVRALPSDPSAEQLEGLVDATAELGRQAVARAARSRSS